MIASFLPGVLQCVLAFSLRLEKSSFPKPLSTTEENKCFNKMKRCDDKKSFDLLVKHNLRLVAHIVKKYYISANDQDDLISIGTIGLIKAVKRYDFKKKIKFATYASRCIENEILMYFRSLKKSANDLFIGDGSGKDENGNLLLYSNLLISPENVEDSVDLNLKKDKIYEIMQEVLTEREQKVLTYRYGLYNTTPLTQSETAKCLNISRSYVSRLEKKAIQAIKRRI